MPLLLPRICIPSNLCWQRLLGLLNLVVNEKTYDDLIYGKHTLTLVQNAKIYVLEPIYLCHEKFAARSLITFAAMTTAI